MSSKPRTVLLGKNKLSTEQAAFTQTPVIVKSSSQMAAAPIEKINPDFKRTDGPLRLNKKPILFEGKNHIKKIIETAQPDYTWVCPLCLHADLIHYDREKRDNRFVGVCNQCGAQKVRLDSRSIKEAAEKVAQLTDSIATVTDSLGPGYFETVGIVKKLRPEITLKNFFCYDISSFGKAQENSDNPRDITNHTRYIEEATVDLSKTLIQRKEMNVRATGILFPSKQAGTGEESKLFVSWYELYPVNIR